mgnify:CR=1 FL=1
MSIGTQIIKTTVLIVLCATLGMSLHSFSSAEKTASNDAHTLSQLQKSYKSALTVAPDKKAVTTNYQKAIDAAKKFRDASQKMQAQPNQSSHAATMQLNRMKRLALYPSKVQGPLLPHEIKGYKTTIFFGGQDSRKRIVMAYRITDKKGALMNIRTFYYHVTSGKLSGFQDYASDKGNATERDAIMSEGNK